MPLGRQGRRLTMANFTNTNGQKLRVGKVLKQEISQALGLSNGYVWSRLIHKNPKIMKRLNKMQYDKKSHFISRTIARFLAKHFDIYVEGVNEEDKFIEDVPDVTSDK